MRYIMPLDVFNIERLKFLVIKQSSFRIKINTFIDELGECTF